MTTMRVAICIALAGWLLAATAHAQRYAAPRSEYRSADYGAYQPDAPPPPPGEIAPLDAPPADEAPADEYAPCDACAEEEEEEEEEECPGLLDCCCFQRHGIDASGHIEFGYTWNADSPDDRQNFGRLFDDRSNDFRLNQVIVTLEKALDEDPACASLGWKAQFMYGSDARFIHNLGFMDNITDDTVQPDIVELFALYHLPILTEGGVDLKVGQFVTLMGAEVIYAPANYFYSKSYIFNFGIPLKHTGMLATTHLSDTFHVHTGVVAGINTGSFDDNNDSLSLHSGFAWNSEDEVTSIFGSLHYGPENDSFFDGVNGTNVDDDERVILSMQIIHKWSEVFTTVTDLNYGWDDAPLGLDNTEPEWYGIAQYFVYTINECTTLIVRAEVFRDDDGFVVFKDTSNDGFIDLEHGIPGPSGFGSLTFGGADTYTAITVGVNRKIYRDFMVRPEVRWDSASETTPFNDSTDDSQFTVGMDAIWSF